MKYPYSFWNDGSVQNNSTDEEKLSRKYSAVKIVHPMQ